VTGFLERLLQAVRLLLRHKRFSVMAILSLAIAIALNTTMYGVLDTMIAPKVLIPDHERLYTLRFHGNFRRIIPQHEIDDAMASVSFAEGTTGVQWQAVNAPVEGSGGTAEADVMLIKPNYFKVLGVSASNGRLIGEADMRDDARPVVVSEVLWRQLFPDQKKFTPAVINVSGDPRLVVGTLPRQADIPGGNTGVWMLPPPGGLSDITDSYVRVKKGFDPATAGAELETLRLRWAERTGESNPADAGFRFWRATQRPFRVRNFQVALIGSVVAVLLVACANLANLQLARGVSRARELATRAAVGASRRDIIGQLMLESGLLAFAGLLLAGILTLWGVHIVDSTMPPRILQYMAPPQISWRVALFAVLATGFCLVVVGLAPALQLSRVDVSELLKSGAGTGRTRAARKQYGALVAIEVALAVAVLCSAALLTRAAFSVVRFDGGMEERGVVTARVALRPESPTDRRSGLMRMDDLINRALKIDGVTKAAVASSVAPKTRSVAVATPTGPVEHSPGPWSYRVVSPEYLRTMRISIVRGRDFQAGEFAEPVVIIDQITAAYLWPGVDPIGKQIKLDSAHTAAPWLTVIGIARTYVPSFATNDDRRFLNQKPRINNVYVLNARDTAPIPKTAGNTGYSAQYSLVVRGSIEAERLPGLVFRELGILMPATRVSYPRTWEQVNGIDRLRESHSFMATLFMVFGLMALALAALGVYAIIAHMVAQRTREFGVRLAIGAGAREIRQLVVREGNVLALLGIAIGLVLTAFNAGFVRQFVFSDDDRWDSRVFAVVCAAIFAIAWLASYIPARRAMRINPVEALRND
jgi:putative ABC transport system permease protein